MKIDVVVLTNNRLAVLQKCLPDLLATKDSSVHITVCAQGCYDGTNEWLQRAGLDLNFIIEEENIGLARYKEFVDTSQADIIVTCDDDCWDFSIGWPKIFRQVLSGDHNVGYVCAVPINGKAGGLPRSWLMNPVSLSKTLTFHMCPCGGWFSGTTRAHLDRVGGWPHADKSLFDLEDALLNKRMRAHGIATGAIEQITCYHACSLNDKVALGLENQIALNTEELHAAGWISSTAKDKTLTEIQNLTKFRK